jgi:hypothetical protein
MIAMTIFMLMIGGSIVLIQQTISAVTLAGSRLVAYSLAQEGIELVRNIRDANWLVSSLGWDDGLGDDTYEADFRSTSLRSIRGNARLLSLDGQGFYSYNAVTCPGDPRCTRYSRIITIVKKFPPGEPVYLDIKCTVQWNEKGNNHEVNISERLYNWFGANPD